MSFVVRGEIKAGLKDDSSRVSVLWFVDGPRTKNHNERRFLSMYLMVHETRSRTVRELKHTMEAIRLASLFWFGELVREPKPSLKDITMPLMIRKSGSRTVRELKPRMKDLPSRISFLCHDTGLWGGSCVRGSQTRFANHRATLSCHAPMFFVVREPSPTIVFLRTPPATLPLDLRFIC